MATLTNVRSVFLAFAVSGAAACRGPMPCPNCDDSADDMQADDVQEDPVPDLPCGGADLMTDPLNCGVCGNNCLWFPGTDWEVGSCEMGECNGPYWDSCEWSVAGATCGEICESPISSLKCVAGGCSGHTALLNWLGSDFASCDVASFPPYATMDGSCDEPIPWEDDGQGSSTYVMCCCG
jgi:hypothetical protein